MKRFLTLLTVALGFVLAYQSCKPDPIEELGSIYGVVTDLATGEPVKNANVQLRPSGETSLTGNDGRYEFLELKNGNYSITVSKTGYTDLIDDYVITVDGSKAMRRDVQIEVLPAELRILDNNGNDIDVLDFGSMHDDESRMFNIFNNSTSAMDYEILKTASWITSISSTQGVLTPGSTKPIIVNIDRDKLALGNNITTISIATNNGGKQLTVKANKAGDLSTLDAINVTHSSAVLRGCVNRDVTYTEKGFYYGTDVNASTKQVVSGYAIGEYSFNMTNLYEQKKYYYKAYMILNGETIYGELKEFTTNNMVNYPSVTTNSITNITETTAMCGGNVTSDGGSAVTAKGVCWGTSQNPTTGGNKTVDGSGVGSFTSTITNLNPNVTYYVRAYATNSEGTSYGEQRSFITTEDVNSPDVTTSNVTNITENSAVCGGNVTSDGGSAVTAKGVCWSTSQNPTINSNKTVDGSGTGSFTSNITGLNHNTTYYVRAYATNSAGTSYGDVKSFTTEDKPNTGEINGHEFVDLGLPSGKKWATCNVGANSPELPGNYYAWGELETKDYYDSNNCSTYNVEMEDISGDPDYDVAAAEWGSSWRMPKRSEVNELFNNCSKTEVVVNGRNCVKLSSYINGNSIILPCTGWMSGTNNAYYNNYGRYWSSTPYMYDNYSAYSFSTSGSSEDDTRYWGMTIRPISN